MSNELEERVAALEILSGNLWHIIEFYEWILLNAVTDDMYALYKEYLQDLNNIRVH